MRLQIQLANSIRLMTDRAFVKEQAGGILIWK